MRRIASLFPDNKSPIEYWIMAGLGLIFLGVGLVTFYLIGRTEHLDCYRSGPEVHCTLTTTLMDRYALRELDISDLRSAQLDESCDEDGCTYRVILAGRRGAFPLSNVYTSNFNEQQGIANRINAYVKDLSQPNLTIETENGWLILVPGVFILVGLYHTGISLTGLLLWSLAQLRGTHNENE